MLNKTHDVMLRRVRANTVGSVCVCVCVCVALGIQHAMRLCHIAICGQLGCTIFFSINGRIFEKKKLNTKCVF
jgi:hypothetical protein